MGAMVHPGPHEAPGWSQANAAVADWLGYSGLSMLVTWQLPLYHLDVFGTGVFVLGWITTKKYLLVLLH